MALFGRTRAEWHIVRGIHAEEAASSALSHRASSMGEGSATPRPRAAPDGSLLVRSELGATPITAFLQTNIAF